jgi:hypothetical protein
MKNPLIKERSNGLWITAAVMSVLAAGTGIWFYVRGKRIAAQLEAYRHAHAQDYLEVKRPHKNKHKTDVSELRELVHHQQRQNAAEI